MKRNKMPKTPFSTAFSGNVTETTLRVQNIVMGQKKRPALPVLIGAVLTIALCGSLLACQSGISTGTMEEPDLQIFQTPRVVREWFPRCSTVYLPGEEPEDPQSGDIRLKSAEYVTSSPVDSELTGALYHIEYEAYYTLGSARGWWSDPGVPTAVVCTWTKDGKFVDALGQMVMGEWNTSTRAIQAATLGVKDLEATLFRDGRDDYAGVGGAWNEDFFTIEGREPTVQEIFPDDDWDFWSVENVISVERLWLADEDEYCISGIYVKDPSFTTYRGIHVGSTREELFAAYPELREGELPGTYEYKGNPNGKGPHIYFHFLDDQSDTIYMMMLMWN